MADSAKTYNTGAYDIGRATATAGTAITAGIPPLGEQSRVSLTDFLYTCAGTAHTLTVLREIGRAVVFADVLAAGVSITLDRDPGAYSVHVARGLRALQAAAADNNIAANDYVMYKAANGNWVVAVVSAIAAVDGTDRVTITVPAVPTGGIQKFAPVIFFGLTTDVSDLSGRAHDSYLLTASVLNTLGGAAGPVSAAERVGSPLLLYIDNITAAGVLNGGQAVGAR